MDFANNVEFILYQTEDENISVDAVIKDESVWLTQKAMAALFDIGVPAINKHLTNIYQDGELQESSTISKMEIVQIEGKKSKENRRKNVIPKAPR